MKTTSGLNGLNENLDIGHIRKQFPILSEKLDGKPLFYLDNGASSQKPETVIACCDKYYRFWNSNIHRGAYFLSHEGDRIVDEARLTIAKFINANSSNEIIFTKGTTDGLNLLATSLIESYCKPGDEVIITQMEHHANIVPWQQECKKKGILLRYIPLTPEGELDMLAYESLLNERTMIVSVVHISNSLGTINPVKEIAAKAHRFGAKVVVDAAQSIAHIPIDVEEIEADFLTCSGHKMYGPMGIGFLYGKELYLNQMIPYQFGGDMISAVSMEETKFAALPNKFEAGTPNVVGIVGLGEAVRFINRIGFQAIIKHEQDLLHYATEKLLAIPELRIYGTSPNKSGVISFIIEGCDHLDIATLLDQVGVSVRNGKHCTHPLWAYFQTTGSVRASFACYNTIADIDALIDGLNRAITLLK